ncbi:FUSC family protein [Mycolicibacterium elephantis]|uniref:FUSC family protein n=1 Tax=Mycolicibacterium elephantis TaxID=81858 RepID=A0A0M2ZDF8_9MYCO|nr:FUSC family protein [Mycolicibacterium elephantis]KKW63651.1 fusaric acid resistance protein [Mycolicibacterium elephantis]OBE95323.1 fusaric acid resistance protein [Mycolicibacterium elephantis]ORA61110.1 FUSC family protein [Mycolicibacterium elephantis]
MRRLWRRVYDRIRQRDPEYDALRRATRAAVVLPIAAAIGFLVGSGSQTPLFAIFGSVALLIVVDFPGNRPARALAYGGLGVNGVVLITLGTLVAPHPWLAVAVMFVLGVVVTFSGVLSEIIAAGQRATLLTFVLPVCTPVGPISERLLGWLIALAVCVPAALFLLPPRHHDELRADAAAVCSKLADALEGAATVKEVTRAMNALWETFLYADFRPVALSAGSRALVRVVDDLGYLSDRLTEDTGRELGEMRQPLVRVLRDCADVLQIPDRAARSARGADLNIALSELRAIAAGNYREDIVEILDSPDDDAAVAVGRNLLGRRTFSATVGVTGRVIRNAAAADGRPVWDRVLGRGLPPTGTADWVMPETTAVAQITRGLLATRAVAFRNAVRTGLGLALAVAVTHLLPVEHGFWVVLGAMSVLRSSALTTGTRVVRAVLGTGIGFVLGVIVIELVGVDPVVMWTLLPFVAFGSAFVPEVASFIAGQAAFTMMVLITFNLIAPTGWSVGLARVEDVAVGALVGVMVSVLLWPRGAAARVNTAIDQAFAVSAKFLKAAVQRVTRGASEEASNRVHTLSHDALVATRTADDAVRQFLSENGGVTDIRAPTVRAANRAVRLRAAAELIADVVPPPLGVYDQTKAVLEAHAKVITDRITGSSRESPPPISDDFVMTLRAEAAEVVALQSKADHPGNGDLAVAAALPLVTVAAHLGGLELLYPKRS